MEVWARRNGRPLLPFADDTLRKFRMGTDFEGQVREAFIAKGIAFQEQVEVSTQQFDGHIDFLINPGEPDAAIVEVKTTTFKFRTVNGVKSRLVKDQADLEHRLQAAAYALLKDCKRFCVFYACRESGMVSELWYETEDYREAVRDALHERLHSTKEGVNAPPAEPPRFSLNKDGKSWKCRYCSFSACVRNENPEALVVPA